MFSCNIDIFVCVWYIKFNCCEFVFDCVSDDLCTVGSCFIEGQVCMYQLVFIDGCGNVDLEDNVGNDVDMDSDNLESMDDDINFEDEFNVGDDLDFMDLDDEFDD